jgi:ornithine--oxo-acid transaminase
MEFLPAWREESPEARERTEVQSRLLVIHPAMFGQVLIMRLFRDKGILTQICGNNFMVLKVAPPLVVSTDQLDRFVDAIHDVVGFVHSSNVFWSEALGLARRVMSI